MCTVYQEQTKAFLTKLGKLPSLTAANVQASILGTFPNINKDAGSGGYLNDPTAEAAICLAYCMHSGLPSPMNTLTFDWTKAHGFSVPQIYLAMPSLQASDLVIWIASALAACTAAMAN